jgi:ABC-2 type transport system ATP-binding protein
MLDQNAPLSDDQAISGDDNGVMHLEQAYVTSRDKVVEIMLSGEPLSVVMVLENISGRQFTGHVGVAIRRPDGLEIASFSTLLDANPLVFPLGRRRLSLNLSELYLTAGRYEMSITLYEENGRRLQEWPQVIALQVQSLTMSPGLLVLPHKWQEN